MQDIKSSGRENNSLIDSQRLFESFCSGEYIAKESLRELYPTRDDFALVYRFIRSGKGFDYSVENLCGRLGYAVNIGKLRVVLEAMNELGLIKINEGIKSAGIKYIETTGKVDLAGSKIIIKLKEMLL